MVLTAGKGGAGVAGAPRPFPPGRPDAIRNVPHHVPHVSHDPGPGHGHGHGGRDRGQRGSQTLEFALVLPLATLLAVLALHAGLLAADLVAVQGLAREAARAAAVSGDAATRAALEQAAGRQPVRLTLDPASPRSPGALVTAQVSLESRAFRAFGPKVWLPARAVMRVEDP